MKFDEPEMHVSDNESVLIVLQAKMIQDSKIILKCSAPVTSDRFFAKSEGLHISSGIYSKAQTNENFEGRRKQMCLPANFFFENNEIAGF